MRKGLIGALLLVVPAAAQAGVYACEVKGRKVYQSTPCAIGDKPIEVKPVNAISAPKVEQRIIPDSPDHQEEDRRRAQETIDERSEKARIQREMKEAIRRGRVLVGMDTADVKAAIGQPDSRTTSMESGHVMEQWVYGGRIGMVRQRVYFKDGRVVSTSE